MCPVLVDQNKEIASTFKKVDETKGLEAHCKEQIDHCSKSLNGELSRGQATLDELLEVFE